MNDVIYRQAAIEVLSLGKEILNRVLDDIDVVGIDREKYSWGLGLIESYINDIKELPPAQPEQQSFEWCHDCKEYDQEKHCCHRWTKTIRKTVDELKQSAQQGAWERCHITTPTGGQHCVWECDGCGARVAERTKYCAECGRKMV